MNPNHPKQPETTRKDRKKLQNDPKFHNWGSMEFPTSFRYFKFRVQTPKFGHFGPKSIDFLILTKFCMYPVLKVLI